MARYAAVACVALLMLGLSTSLATAEEVVIQVSPSTINLAYEGEVVTVHADIPYSGVVTASLKLNGVEVWWTKADNQGNLVAKFDVDSVKDIIAVPSADLELSGMVEIEEGFEVPFSGSDTVKVVDNSGRK